MECYIAINVNNNTILTENNGNYLFSYDELVDSVSQQNITLSDYVVLKFTNIPKELYFNIGLEET